MPYATPFTAAHAGSAPPEGMWRCGRTLVTLRNVAFPPRCVKCNAPVAESGRISKRLLWHHPGLYVLAIVPGVLVYIIVAACVRTSAHVNPCLCDVHRRQRRTAILMGWLLFLGGLATIVGAGILSGSDDYGNGALPGNIGFVGTLTLVTGIAWGYRRGRLLVPTKIGEQYACYGGADDVFLDSLPPGARP